MNNKSHKIEDECYKKADSDYHKILSQDDENYLIEKYAEMKNTYKILLRKLPKDGIVSQEYEYEYYYLKFMEELSGDALNNLLLFEKGYERNRDGLYVKKEKKDF